MSGALAWSARGRGEAGASEVVPASATEVWRNERREGLDEVMVKGAYRIKMRKEEDYDYDYDYD
jgi:hypothetical protein